MEEVTAESDGPPKAELRVTITSVGPKAKTAGFGLSAMQWGDMAPLDQLEQLLAR